MKQVRITGEFRSKGEVSWHRALPISLFVVRLLAIGFVTLSVIARFYEGQSLNFVWWLCVAVVAIELPRLCRQFWVARRKTPAGQPRP